jgi:dolichol-phosphate mannosyltransferase
VTARWRRIAPAGCVGAIVDVGVYLGAITLAQSPVRSQAFGFLAAIALVYLPRFLGEWRGRGWSSPLALHLIALTLLSFCLRSGLFVLLTQSWVWPAQAAIAAAAIGTALMIPAGYRYCVSYPTWSLGLGAGWRAWAFGAMSVALALRLIYAGQVELLPEEAYYWNYARHLDFGYLDHPPMVAWIIAAGGALFGGGEFGVRIGAMCCAAIGALFMYRLTRNLFGEPSAVVAVTLMQTLPFFFLTGMLMTPDAPLTAAWAASLYCLERALLAGRSEAWWGAGVCFGVGLLSKYTIALLGISTLIFMLIDSRSRRWFVRVEPYGAAALAMAIFSPVIVWNAQHEWASFVFQTSHRLADRPQFALPKLIASAFVLLTPSGIAAVTMIFSGRTPQPVAAQSPDSREPSAELTRRAWRFIQVSTLTPLAVFAIFSLRHEVKLDWTGAPWLAALPALAVSIVQGAQAVINGTGSWIDRSWVPTLLVLLLAYGAGLYHFTLGLPGVGYGRHAELVPVGWRELGTQVGAIGDDLQKQTGAAPLIVGMDRYAIASELAFYAPDRARAVRETSSGHLFGQVGLMYERWFPISAEKGRALVLVAWNRADLDSDRIATSVDRLEPIREGVLTRARDTIRPYYYRLAFGYRGLPTTQ